MFYVKTFAKKCCKTFAKHFANVICKIKHLQKNISEGVEYMLKRGGWYM